MLDENFLLQALVLGFVAIGFLTVAIRTWFADQGHYEAVQRRSKSARDAAEGTVGHGCGEEGDATVVHGMAVRRVGSRRVIVRNGKIARDSVSAC